MSCVANRQKRLNVHRSFFVVMTRVINVCEFEKKRLLLDLLGNVMQDFI